jgi:hypothetical protein
VFKGAKVSSWGWNGKRPRREVNLDERPKLKGRDRSNNMSDRRNCCRSIPCIYYNIYIYIYGVAADKSSFADVIECIRRTVSDQARRGSHVHPLPETTPLWNARWAAGDTIGALMKTTEPRDAAPTLHIIIIIIIASIRVYKGHGERSPFVPDINVRVTNTAGALQS